MKAVLLLLSLSLVSCVQYAPKGSISGMHESFGYSDRQIGENKYLVKFKGNRFSSFSQLEKFVHRRAEELCGSSEYEMKTSNSMEKTYSSAAYVSGGSGYMSYPLVTGYLTCKNKI